MNRTLIALVIAAMATVIGCGGEDQDESEDRGAAFPAWPAWTRPLARDAPVDERSPELVAELRRQVELADPWINTTEFSVPLYTVPGDQRRVKVTLDTEYPQLEQAFTAVPLPPDAAPARGSDAHLALWQPSTDTVWEFWKLARRPDGWHARWGGRMEHASGGTGSFPDPLGATATGIPLMAGLIRPSELRSGRIEHALAFALPEARAGVHRPPATRTDGQTDSPDAIPLGTRFRLDPSLDLEELGLPAPTLALARAAQRYGMVARDKSGAVAFYAEAPKPGADNPYPELFGDRYPSELLRAFPWDRLQAMAAPERR